MTVSIRTPQAWLARSGAAVVLSLETLREQVCMQWDAICTPTGARLERLFRAKLGPSDRFARLDEISWLVVMPDTDIDDALSCCLRIAYQLHNAVAPPCELEQLMVASAVAKGDDILEVTSLSEEQLRIVARRAGIDALATASLEAFAEAADVPHRFEPVWDSRHQMVNGYRCLPEGSKPGETVGQQLTRTQIMLASMARVLDHPFDKRRIVFLPLPYDVLSTPPARMELLSTCRALRCELRPSMVFEITTLGAGIPKYQLAEIVSAIQPFARTVIARSAPGNRSLADYGGTGLTALGFDLGSQSDESEIYRSCEIGKRLGTPFYFNNVSSQRKLDQATTLGAQWISGPVIGTPVEEPTLAPHLTFDATLRNLHQSASMGAVG